MLNWTPRTRGWGGTRKGNSHARNEDAFVLLDHPVRTRGVSDRGCVYAVSDGVSTVAEGHWASQLTISRLSQFFDAHSEPSETSMTGILSEIDWEIRGERSGRAACTVAVAWIQNNRLQVFQVGDSHVFLLRKGAVRCLTELEEESGKKLDHFLGMGPAVSEVVRVSAHEVQAGDALVLATDGVTNLVSEDELGRLWARSLGDPAACTEAVLAAVARQQGSDDATIVAALVL